MFYFLVSVNIIALILMLFMLAICLRKKLSKVQLAFIIYDIFTMLFVVGVHLELVHSDTVGEALAGLCIQYVGQAGFLMAFLWFASEFGRLKIPKFIYFIQAVVNAIVLVAVFSNRRDYLGDSLYPSCSRYTGSIYFVYHALRGEFTNS